jgi:hypothetical protein
VRLRWGYGDERAVGDAVPPIPPKSEEPRWIAQIPDIKILAGMAFCLWEFLSSPCLDRYGTSQARSRPGESPMWIAQAIGIEGLAVVTLAADEAHIT